MFVALSDGGNRVIAWEVEKGSSAFHCPHCEDQVILRKGNVYVHHFAHKPGSKCPNAGESMQHMKIKQSVFLSLRGQIGSTKCAMERRLEAVRPDVSLRISGTPVAVEIQLSSITETEINRRLLRYSDMGIYCLWVMARDDIVDTPPSQRGLGYQGGMTDGYRKTTKKWERALHTLYGGRVYYWQSGAQVLPGHFYLPAGYKRDAAFEFLCAKYRGRRTRAKQSLNIARDFETGNALIGGYGGVPVLIWRDNKPDWWDCSA